MKLLFTIFLFCSIFSTGYSQDSDKLVRYSLRAVQEFVPLLLHVKDTLIPNKEGKLMSEKLIKTGSSILINYKKERVFLITAEHVRQFLEKSSLLILSDNFTAKSFSLNTITKGKSWKSHEKADLAVIEITDKENFEFFIQHSFPCEQVLFDSVEIKDNAEVTMMGYPIYDVTGARFFPIPVKSNCLPYLINWNNLKNSINAFYVLTEPSIQGLSGGPAFIGVTHSSNNYFGPSKTWLVGITSATKSDDTGGKLGMITPVFYLKEIIENMLN